MRFAKSLTVIMAAATATVALAAGTSSANAAEAKIGEPVGQTAGCSWYYWQDGVEYCGAENNGSRYYRVSNFQRGDGLLDVPTVVDNAPVTGIGVNGDAVNNKESIRTLKINSKNMSINAHAFDGAGNLANVDLTSVTKLWIDTNSFARTSALKNFGLPADNGTNKVSLGKKVFDNSALNKEIVIGENTGYTFPFGEADFASNGVTIKHAADADQTTTPGDDQTTAPVQDAANDDVVRAARTGRTYNMQGMWYELVDPEDADAFWVATGFDGYSDNTMHIAATVDNIPVKRVGMPAEDFKLASNANPYKLDAQTDVVISAGTFAKANTLNEATVTADTVIQDGAFNSNVRIVRK